MTRDEFARMNYRKDRYLWHLSENELTQRGFDLINSLRRIDSNGKIAPATEGHQSFEPFEKWNHFLEELDLRGLNLNELIKKTNNAEEALDLKKYVNSDFAKVIKNDLSIKNAQLFKFGQRKYFEPLISEGKFRIQAASSFSNEKLSNAARDNEIERTFKLAVTNDELNKDGNLKGFSHDGMNHIFEFNFEYITDYWLTCFAKTANIRLATDFSADAVLAIYDLDEFASRLAEAFRKRQIYSKMVRGAVTYYDPYTPIDKMLPVPLLKPLKYKYQEEYRIYWIPKEPIAKLSHVDINLKKISDICKIFYF